MDKQRSTKHTHKTKDRVTLTPLKTGSELMCSGRVGSATSSYKPCDKSMRKGQEIAYQCIPVFNHSMSFQQLLAIDWIF